MSSSRVEVDLRAVDHNLRVIRGIVNASAAEGPAGGIARAPVAVCAVLKQDAYGLGAVRIAKRLTVGASVGGSGGGNGGGGGGPVQMLAVYSLEEVRNLIEANVTTTTLVLKPVRDIDRTDPTYRAAAAGRLHLALHDLDQLQHLERLAQQLGFGIPVHIFVDTGLGRGGSLPEEATAMVQRIVKAPGGGVMGGPGGPRVRLAGVMTHFASSCHDGAATREQARLFREWVASVREMLPNQGAGLALHASNTCGMLRSDKYHGTMVRVGQSIYGYALEGVEEPESMAFAAAARTLEPAVRWTSSIVHVKEIPPGFPVGYGSTWHAPQRPDGRPTRIAVVPVGYADGYPRALSNKGWVGLNGRRWERKGPADDGGSAASTRATEFAPVVGRVSMDQVTIDVTEVSPALLWVGAEVEIAGADRTAPNYLPTVAEASGSIPHEFLCRMAPRGERLYKATVAAATPSAGPMIAPEPGRAAVA